MQELLLKGYTPKRRPSGHAISDKFQRRNAGAIPPNLLALANAESNSRYQRFCREHGLPQHPARFPEGIPAFFLRLLTDPGDVVLDPFAGSCVTGAAAEKLGRRWLCCELHRSYVAGALGRFAGPRGRPRGPRPRDRANRRRVPYRIYPPVVAEVDEPTDPLPADGGRARARPRGIVSAQ